MNGWFAWIEKEFATTPAPNGHRDDDDVPLTIFAEEPEPPEDIENNVSVREVDELFVARLVAYMQKLIGRAPETDTDLIIGIAYVERDSHWVIPFDHPIGELFMQNNVLPITLYNTIYGKFGVYDSNDIEWIVRAIIDLWNDRDNGTTKIKTTKCVLWPLASSIDMVDNK